jgi:hypothetical protein
MVKSPVDNSEHFRNTEYHLRDKVYNWLVRRYGQKGNVWQTSDTVVWQGAIYHVWPWIPALLFIYVTYFIANWTYEHYGMFRALTVLAVMMLIRVNTLVRKLDQLIRVMKGGDA